MKTRIFIFYGCGVRNSILLEYDAVSLRTRFAFLSACIGQRGAHVSLNITLYGLHKISAPLRRSDGHLK